MPTTPRETTAVNDPVAHDMLRGAHDGGYRFPLDFNGFSASISVVEGTPDQVAELAGTITVGGPRAIELDATGPDELLAFARQELASMAGHRWPSSYDQSDGRWTLTIEDDAHNPLGRLVTVHDDPFHSSYRLRDGRISQVIREMGPTRFAISIQNHAPTVDGRVLPAEFTVTYWSIESGRMTRADAYTDRYETVDGVSIPISRRVLTATDDGFSAREFTLSNIVLLTEPVAPVATESERHGTRAG
jgi:hypothetical protein